MCSKSGATLNAFQRCFGILSRIDLAFAHGVYAAPVAEQFIVELLEFCSIVSQARRIGRFVAGHHGSLLDQFVNAAQHRQRHVLAVRIQAEIR